MLSCTCLKKGSGIPLVFLHGFLGSSSDWNDVCSFLSKGPCFGVDLPGHGASLFTENFCNEMPFFSRMHLIGYSMGGRLALQYASRFPEQIASLTIASAHCGLKSAEEKKKRLAADAEWAQKLLELDLDEFLARWYDQPIFGKFTPDLTMRRRQNPAHLAQCLVHYSLGKQPVYSFKDAHFIVGEKDEKYRLLFPRATVLSNCAHMLHLENPKDFAQIINERILS